MKFKKFRSIMLATSLIIGITLSSSNVYAASYNIVSGDSLNKISKIFNTSISSLISDNKLTSINLNIGQRLNVPGSTYTVKRGDTLYLISKAHNVPLDTLRRANNIYSNYIDIGQKLIIPAVPVTVPDVVDNTLSYSASDLDLLARLITAEAQGELYNAQVAVGAVVLNRFKSGLFKSTINGVIYEVIDGHYQFTPVANGWINKPATAESIRAAKEALSGVDPSKGAMFYYDNTTTNKWILSRPVTVRIDNMIFCY